MTKLEIEDQLVSLEQTLMALAHQEPEYISVYEAQRHALNLWDQIRFKEYMNEILPE